MPAGYLAEEDSLYNNRAPGEYSLKEPFPSDYYNDVSSLYQRQERDLPSSDPYADTYSSDQDYAAELDEFDQDLEKYRPSQRSNDSTYSRRNKYKQELDSADLYEEDDFGSDAGSQKPSSPLKKTGSPQEARFFENILEDRTLNKAAADQAKKKTISKSAIFLYLISSFVWWDLWFRIFVNKGFELSGVFLNLLFCLSLSAALTLVITLFPAHWWRRVLAVPLVIIMIFFGAQYIYHQFFRTLFTWFSMLRGGQVAEFAEDVAFKLLGRIPIVILILLPLIVLFVGRPLLQLLKKREILPAKWFERADKSRSMPKPDKIMVNLFLISVTLVAFTFGLLFIHLGDRSVNSAYDLYFETNDPLLASGKLGLLTAMSVDLRHFIFSSAEIDLPPDETLPEDILIMETDHSDQSEQGDSPSILPTGTGPEDLIDPEPTPVPIKDFAFPIDFEKIIENESNDSLRNMAHYFNDIEPSKSNDHTGMFKGYNLIFITAESHSAYSAHPELTPTLWHMQENGIKFNNFYNPIWGVSTSDGEYTGITGLAPKPGVWSLVKSSENDMAMTPGNMLRRLGYVTSAWHNHTYTYYGRDKSHPNLGYDTYKGLGNGLEVKKSWPESDLEMMEKAFDEFTAVEPFHAYFMTVSGHMNYTFRGNAMATKNRDYVRDLDLNEGGRAYLATQVEVDKAMEYLLTKLREKGIADRTLIVFNADHYPYGLEKEDYDQLAGKTLEENFEIYKNSLMIYADGMEPETVDRVCFTLDILPTLYNLMDIPFDSRLLMGSDVFSDRSPLAFFVNRSWITDKGRYNAVTKEFTPEPGAEIADQERYISDITNSVRNKLKYSAQILDYDYFGRILPDSIWDIVNEDSGYPVNWSEEDEQQKILPCMNEQKGSGLMP